MKNQPSSEKSLNSSTLPLDDPSNLQGDQTIISQQKIQKYVNDKKELYNSLLMFLEDSENSDQNLQNLNNIIDQRQEEEKKETFEQFLILITDLFNNYHRDDLLFKKIFQILKYYENQIKQIFSNYDIYNIFQSNKLILLFLLENKIMTIDDKIYLELMTKIEINGLRYSHFFYPEIKEFIGEQKAEKIKEELSSINSQYVEFDYFNEKRHIGENDSYICHSIRQDSVEDFISYVNKSCISLTGQIAPSLFETNSFLNESSPTLIEYSAFYGSIQIFQYLLSSITEKIDPKVWLYVIHSKNPELIQLLEQHKVQPDDEYEKCFIESIKCHHHDVAEYINENYYGYYDDPGKREEVVSNALHYHNYKYFPTDFAFGYELFHLCRYNYSTLVDLFMKRNEKEIKEKIKNDDSISFKSAEYNDKIEIVYYLMSKQTRIEDYCFHEYDVLGHRNDDNLYRVAIPSSITSIGNGSFYNCVELTHVVIPSSVTSIGRGAFRQCSALTQINIPSSVTSIDDYCFYKCSNLSRIEIPSSVASIGKHSFFGCTSLTQISIPFAVKSIENFTFSNCSLLKQVILHSSLLEIKDSAFSECTSLNQISIPSSVISIGNWSFAGCTSLQQINIPSSVTSFGNGLFSGCSRLARINIPSSVTSIGSCSFYKCTSLTQISLPPSITSIESCLFYGCSSLTDINVSSQISKIGLMAFYGCSSLKSNLTELVPIEKIGTLAFYGCSSIDSKPTQINSSENIDDYEIEKEMIGAGAFTVVAKCTNKKTGQEFALKFYQTRDFTDEEFMQQIAISSIPGLAEIHSFRLPLTNAERNNVRTLDILLINKRGQDSRYDLTGYLTFSEVMENGCLAQITNEYLKNQKVTEKMNPTIRSKLIFGIASIMKHLHKMNVVHHDLKLEKILLDDKLEPKIIDFVLASFNMDPCKLKMVVGTPFCMAPELFIDDSEHISFPIDVYAFAFLLYKMFSSKITFEEIPVIRSPQQFMMKIARNFRPRRPENIPDHYWELIQKCWQQNPDDRPTFEEIVNTLKDDKFALEEFGIKTDLDQLHEYQKRIDND